MLPKANFSIPPIGFANFGYILQLPLEFLIQVTHMFGFEISKQENINMASLTNMAFDFYDLPRNCDSLSMQT